MRVKLKERTFLSSGSADSHVMQVEVEAKTYDTLLNAIYVDKPPCIVRELMSNCWDSHVMAGIGEKPFDVHLPTIFEPDFYVRDYGISMSHDFVKNKYGVLFKSTKENVDTAIGRWGLGGKVPLAWVSQYYLTCWLDGEQRDYIIAYNNEGKPVITLMQRKPSDEPRGVKVGFAVEEKDRHLFEAAFKDIVRGFQVKPTCNKPDLIGDMGMVIAQKEAWTLFDVGESEAAGETGWWVRMGPILYPLRDRGGLNLPPIARTQWGQATGTLAVVLDMPIGAVVPTTSREDIEYSAETVEMLKDVIDGVAGDMAESVNETLVAAETALEFSKLRRPFNHSMLASKLIEFHPATGLREPTLLIGEQTDFMMEVTSFGERWDYEERACALHLSPGRTVILLEDIADAYIFDSRNERFGEFAQCGPDGSSNSHFTRSERRILTRQLRYFMLNRDIQHAIVFGDLMGGEDFLNKVTTDLDIIVVGTAALLKEKAPPRAVRQRAVKTGPTPIRGLRLLTDFDPNLSNPKPTAVYDLAEVEDGDVFICSEVIKKASYGQCVRLAQAVGLSRVLLASKTARERLTEADADVLSIYDYAKLVVETQWHLNFAVWLRFCLGRHSILPLQRVARFLLGNFPDTYKEISEQRNHVGKIFRAIRPYIMPHAFIDDREMGNLLTEHETALKKRCEPVTSAECRRLQDMAQALPKENHPLIWLLRNADSWRHGDTVRRLPEMIRTTSTWAPLEDGAKPFQISSDKDYELRHTPDLEAIEELFG